MMVNFGKEDRGLLYAEGGEINVHTKAKEMSSKEYDKLYSSLTDKEIKSFDILVRLGDSKKLALATIVYQERIRPDNSEFYRKAYEYAGGGEVDNTYSGNYYSSTSFVSENGLIDLAKKTFGNDWESGGDYDSDTEEIKMLLNQLDGEYVVFYVDPDERDEDAEKTIFEDAKSRYRDLINHTSNDGDIFVVLKNNLHKGDSELVDSYAEGGSVKSNWFSGELSFLNW